MGLENNHHARLVEALSEPGAYPHSVRQVYMSETHVSWLFFTGDTVYKVKKPVDYGFLDFTSLEKRRYYCQREVELNSRLSADVYMGVVPICEEGGRIRAEGPGETIEYAVKMRQLPQDRAMNDLLRHNQLSTDEVQQVAAKIAAFHKAAAASEEVTKLGDLSVVRQNIEENFQQTEQYIGKAISQDEYDDLAAYSEAFMDARAGVFERRASQGRVRDGHGDLHTANIFLDNGIHVIDCIEFNDRFRCQDVAEDIAFLVMDLDYYGRRDLSEVFISAYVQASQDPGLLELLDFFKAYRAYVRGKVTSFCLDDESLSDGERQEAQKTAQGYFRLARSYTRKAFPRPLLVLSSGLMGTGKTYIGQELARRWDMAYFSSDETRKRLAGITSTEHRYESYGQGIYSPEFTRRTYDAMYEDTRQYLSSGKSVLLDATFRSASERRHAAEAADVAGADLYIVECVTSENEIRRRLERRTQDGEATASDGRWELFQQQKADWEPVREVPQSHHIRLDTTGSREDTIRALLRLLFERALSDPKAVL